ncbi:restriction endonuclease subunit S [Halomonas meridiana]|uniref:restriction endonuclease subunit S n=1 Tax=Vreelandella aquamarina TaxID=77097 RepID=UPI001E553D8E|nr:MULTISPECIES: restriction endonuclease subunit S [Halomonas]MCD1651517.1 restriction endonuclease subunit S [Halomonas axialensis]MCD2087715.1 restriction endonuclease subunit S [Halomonas meridiana]
MNIAAYPTHELTSTTQVAHLPVIPSHWEVRRVKYASNLKSEKIASKGCDLPYIGMENVQSWSGNLLEGGSEVEGLATTFEAGDILFGKLRPYLAKVVKPGFSGICSSEFLVFQSTKDTFGDFLAYALRSSDFISLINGSTYGAKMPRANPDFIANAEIPFPPLPEQRAIAAFLDNKSAKIDQAVRIKEAQIKLLRERRQILIQQAVTRGLNPDAPMKDSGIDWIGEIPLHWHVKRLRHATQISPSRRVDGNMGRNDHVVFLPMEAVGTNGGVRETFICSSKEVSEGFTYFQRGDVIMAKITPCFENGKGAFLEGLLSEYGFGTTELHVLRPKEITGKFLYYFISRSDFRKRGEVFMVGSAGQKRVSTGYLKDQPISVPPINEQKAIVSFLDNAGGKIDKAISIKQEQISKLKEYKTTLINAAVTGKIKVS